MNEGNQIGSSQPITPNKKSSGSAKWISITLGTVVALFAGLGLYQGFYAEQASALTENNAPGTARAVSPANKALANVNGYEVSYDAVAAECFSRIGQEVLENVINRIVIQQEVQKRGLTITEAEVHQEVTEIAKQVNLPVDTYYQILRTERNISPAQYQRDVVWPKLALQKLAGTDVEVTQEEMQKAFIRDYGPRVRCKMIMLDNIRRANEIWAKVSKNPETFEVTARESSIEPNSKSLGGAFPPIQRYSSNKHMEDAAFRLKPNEISGLIPIGVKRYVILKCEGRTEPIVTDINEVATDLKKSIIDEKVQSRVAEVFNEIKKSARVDNFLTNHSTRARKPVASTGVQNTGTTGNTANQVTPTSGTVTR